MNAPGVDALHVVETLRAELPAALASGAVPGAEGWALGDVRTERLFDRAFVTLTFTREAQSLRAHLFPTHALADPAARIRHFDLYHRDDLLAGHAPRAQSLLAGLLRWLDERFAEASEVSLHDPAAPATPGAPPEIAAVVAGLTAGLPALLASDALAGWSLTRVGVERFQFLYVPRFDLARGADALHLYLLPRGTEEKCHFHTARFDMVYDDDARGSTYTRHHAAMERIVAWLEATFPAPPPPAATRTPAEALARELDARLAASLRDGSLPALAGWAFEGAAVEPFRDADVPTLRLARDGRSLALRVLPTGTEPTAVLRTDRFDLLYDDDARGSTYTRDHAALEQLAAWLGASFPAATAPAAPTPRSPAESLTRELDARLAASLRDGSLPELAGWAFEGAAVEPFRDADVPTLRLTRDGRSLALRVLPTGAEPTAILRTDRFDLLYDDDARGTGFTRDHAALEGLARWLGEAFPAEGGARARPRPRVRNPEAPDEATRQAEAEAAAVDAALARAVAAGELPELGAWAFEGVALESFRDRDVPTAHFSKGPEVLKVRLLPASAESSAYLRTDRFDLLYDDDDGALFARHHALLEGLTRWLAAAFPLGESEQARELARRRALRAQQLHAPADLVAFADSLEARMREAAAAGALTLPEGWRFEGVGVEQQQGVTAPAARFLHGERAFVLRLLPTAPERAAFLRTARFDVLYDSEPGDWQLQDEPVARGFVAWLESAYPADPPPPEPASP